MSGITEDAVERAMLDWLAALGWQTAHGPDISPPDAKTPGTERGTYRDVVLRHRLAAAMAKLNPHIPAVARDDALRHVLNANVPGLVNANRQFYRCFVDGVPVEFQKDGETRGDRVRLVDFTDVIANDWLAVNQLAIQGPKQLRRPDVVLYLNGLPIAVVELKNPGDENADIWAAWNQLRTYHQDIPDLFNANALEVISDGTTARMGSLTSNRERFLAWRTIDGHETDPLGAMHELETLTRGLFRRDYLLEYLHHFILFEDDGQLVKKVAAYHQFHAVRAVVQSVLQASAPGGSRKGGVVWHTQGAGKSIEMTCLAGALMANEDMGNPTLVVVTDRNDLDNQLFGVFAGAKELLRETPVQADTRPDLRRLLANRPSGGIIFTTIQKFTPGADEDTFPVLSGRRNIVVICDEAHRSQYGFDARLPNTDGKGESTAVRYGYAQYLRDALPEATFVAFTGTPVSLDDRDTRAVFGDYVHIYDIEQAVKDGATVPIYYESRLASLELKEEDADALDDEVDELTEDEESDEAKVATLRRWAALEKIVGAPPRIQKIAADIVSHLENRQSVMDGKAMIVAMSRDICVHLYNAITQLRPEWHSDDPTQGAIKIVMTGSASDKAMLKPHIHPKKVRDDLEKRFKDPADPFKLVIVRDMWLTGFDAPCMHTMYIDKPMRGHNLMQAIARVNRVFKDKPGGLVVDYIGIANELKVALATYTQAHGRGRPTIDAHEALAILAEKMDLVHNMLHGIDYAAFRTQAWQLLPDVADHVLGQDDGKKRFADTVLAASKAFALCCTLDEALAYRDELAFLQAVKAALIKHDGADKALTDEQKEHALRQIISRAVVSDQVIDIFSAAGLKRPDISVLSDGFLEDVRHMQQRNLAVELLERLLKDQIKSRFKTNIVQSAKFSELLQQSLTRYRNRAVETAQVIEELIAMAKKFQAEAQRGMELGLSPDEMAFYDALATNEAAVRELGDETLKKIAVELVARLRSSVTVDWAKRDTVRAKLRVMVRTLLKRYKYPPDRQEEATDTVLRQAESLSAEWA
ncbi:HsdR family type I site-specific deoxyribonuclease [Burkholderia pseudomallei]|uniref:type I restriction endonuclease subunit R n=1 Tax=Burkholderia thailandensis TaxID=57975 RepID=UPI00148EB2AF|nr:type I restriction endonuclease subunit R [Burkholderia thailandensis]CAJ3981567.1 HsdR family type I site-specific deoxyribonuclease [Burkholderia pseudomallei]NOK56142.1 DEAD/DEAH box helicase [Burkholderia thailandensis]CAJ8062710.1 HsdR family type I site-specific deoxyribonuclease [Burkholderia pseudomallei]CAJ9913196.1 HsdR family type I site-specific deoxyribonuclease [Burkholderia pseudomallei]CAK0568866.1 HsdR family type I site-specific deoxyribonuclease [Burkholderia pseudomallei